MPARQPAVRDSPKGAVLTIHVQPNARRTEYAGLHGTALKFRVASPPADGAANDALCRFLSRECGVPRSAIVMQGGHGSRQKRVLVKGVTSRRMLTLFPVSSGRVS